MVSPKRLLPPVFVALVLTYLYAPIAVILLFSITISPRLSLPIEGLTLSWYANAFSNPLMSTALRNSFILALVSATLSSLFGGAFAF